MASESAYGGDGSSRSRATWTNITVGTDSTGLKLGQGKPMFRSGMATAEFATGNRYNPLIDWNFTILLFKFLIRAGFDFNAGVAGPSVAFKWDTDITLNANGTGVVDMKNDVYNTGFYAGAFLNIALTFRMWYYAPWDCSWHQAVDKDATFRIDLIDLLIKIFGFCYKKAAGPPKNSPDRPQFENNVSNKVDIATAIQGAWNMFESGHYTYALGSLGDTPQNSSHTRSYGAFDFCPSYTLGGSWSPWDALSPAFALVINAIANACGVNCSLDAGLELAFPGYVYAWGWNINSMDFSVSSISTYQNSDMRRCLKQNINKGTAITVPGSLTNVQAKVKISTDCQPRLYAGLTFRAGFLGSWSPRWTVSLWDILGIPSPALWVRDDTVSQNRSFDPSQISQDKGRERFEIGQFNPYDQPPIDVVFHPVKEPVA